MLNDKEVNDNQLITHSLNQSINQSINDSHSLTQSLSQSECTRTETNKKHKQKIMGWTTSTKNFW